MAVNNKAPSDTKPTAIFLEIRMETKTTSLIGAFSFANDGWFDNTAGHGTALDVFQKG